MLETIPKTPQSDSRALQNEFAPLSFGFGAREVIIFSSWDHFWPRKIFDPELRDSGREPESTRNGPGVIIPDVSRVRSIFDLPEFRVDPENFPDPGPADTGDIASINGIRKKSSP